MNTFIFLGCVPVPEHKIDFVTKTVLDKENTYILVRKKKNIYILPPQRTPLRVFGVKKVAVLGGGRLLYTFAKKVNTNWEKILPDTIVLNLKFFIQNNI